MQLRPCMAGVHPHYIPPTPFLPFNTTDLVNDELVGVGEALFRLSPELFLVLGESRPQSPQRVRRSNQHRVTDLPFQTFQRLRFRLVVTFRFVSNHSRCFGSRSTVSNIYIHFVSSRQREHGHVRNTYKDMPLRTRYSIVCTKTTGDVVRLLKAQYNITKKKQPLVLTKVVAEPHGWVGVKGNTGPIGCLNRYSDKIHKFYRNYDILIHRNMLKLQYLDTDIWE